MKSSKFASSAAAIATIATLTSCGLSTGKDGSLTLNSSGEGGPPQSAGYVTQQKRPVTDFHAIENHAVCTIVITDGRPFSLVVEADQSIIAQLNTDVKDGVLSITLDKNTISNPPPIRVLISMPKLDKFTNAGVGQATLSGLQEPFLTIKESGAGSITASGSADMVDLTLSGVGNANLKDLKAKAVTALLSGTGSAKVSASESLTATVSGIGKLTYTGTPPKVQKSVTGLGSISAE